MEPGNQAERLGILGGLGPLASARFLSNIYRLNHRISKEQDLPAVILLSDPQFPDRTECLLQGKFDVLIERTIKDCEKLREMGASHILICCYTLHSIINHLPENIRKIIIPLPDLALQQVEASNKRSLLLCTEGSRKFGVFTSSPIWKRVEPIVVLPSESDQKLIHNVIYSLKQNLEIRKAFEQLLDICSKYKCTQWILGCTELHLLSSTRHDDISVAGPTFINGL